MARSQSALRVRSREICRAAVAKSAFLRGGSLDKVYAGFRSLFQGDHLGVEYALQSHTSLLQRAGLLTDNTLVLRNHAFPRGPLWEGLVIDDYFILSREKVGGNSRLARSVELLGVAEEAYKKAGALGSDDKTISGSDHLKAIGAEILSAPKVLGAGLTMVGAPLEKRNALAASSSLITMRSVACHHQGPGLSTCWKLGLCADV